ncbi:MAG: PAS domain S-box protein [Cyanobacteria bacterium P01_D01_bin.105]
MPHSAHSSPDSLTTLEPGRKLSLLVQNSPLAMIEWDRNLIVQSWNPAAAALFNFFEEEALGQRLNELLDERQMADLEKKDWQSCEPSGVLRSHVTIMGKKLCRWYNTPFLVNGQRVGTLATIVETTHQTALSNEELQSQLQSRTRVLKHTTEQLQQVMNERLQTDAALQAHQTRFDSLAANLPGALYQFCLKADGHQFFPYISATCEDLYELSASALSESAETMLALLEPNDRLSLKVSIQKSAETLCPLILQHRITTASGQKKWIQMTAQPQQMPNGDTIWSGMLMDISKQRTTEKQLQDTYTFLEHLTNAIADPLFIKDKDHKLILFNDSFCRFVGRSHDALIGRSDTDFMPQADANEVFQQDEKIMAGERCDAQKSYFTDANGQIKYISMTKTSFRGADNQPYLLGTIRDITQQSIAQKALKASEKRLKKLTANVPGMLFQFRLDADLSPSFPFVSESSETLLWLSPEQIQADANVFLECIHPEDRTDFDQSIALSAQHLSDWQWCGRAVLRAKQTEQTEQASQADQSGQTQLSGKTVWIQAASRPERRPDSSILWDGLLMDITENKEAEAALQKSETQLRSQTQQLQTALKQLRRTQSKLIQSEKMSSLGQLVAGIAHEINNPVTFIQGNLTHAEAYIQDMMKIIKLYQAHYPAPIPAIQAISDELELDYVLCDLPELLQSVQAGSDRIRQIVLSLRNFSRLDESELKRTDIHEGIESTLMILSSRLKATPFRSAIKIVKAYENIPPIDCYASQLNQVFMNILVNAIDAIDIGCESDEDEPPKDDRKKAYQIALQTFQKEARVIIRIANNGPPIPADAAQRMFDPFFTTKPIGKGTGMGLAVSYQTIVDLHKGTLEHSQTDDKQTVFTIEIPSTVLLQPSVTAELAAAPDVNSLNDDPNKVMNI